MQKRNKRNGKQGKWRLGKTKNGKRGIRTAWKKKIKTECVRADYHSVEFSEWTEFDIIKR